MVKRLLLSLALLLLAVNAHATTWFSCNGDSSCGAYVQIFEGGNFDQVSGQNSPVGSTNVWRYTIPEGFPMGGSVASVWVATLPESTQEMWIQYYWKYSPGFYLYNINKHVYFGPSNTMGVGLVGGWGVNCQPQGWGQANHPPNVDTSYDWYMNTGQWHKMKAHYRLNTPGAGDGIFQAWVDDVMTNNYSNVQYVEEASGFQYPGFLMIPSGGGPNNPTLGYWYVSGIYVGSTDPGGAPSGDTLTPYISGQDPPEGATGVPTSNKTTIFHVKDDRTNDTGVNIGSISAVINTVTRNSTSSPPLTCTGSAPDYTCTFVNGAERADAETVDVAISATDLAGNVMPTHSYQYTQASVATNTYTTTFPTDEALLHQDTGNGPIWWNGEATGRDWANVKVSGGNASGTQVRDPARPNWYNDSIAILKGTWNADQSIEGVIYLANQTDGGVSGFGSYDGVDCNQEIELCVRGSMSPGAVRMYCMDVSARQDSTAYHESGAWIGNIDNFFVDKGYTSTMSSDFIVHDGDTIKYSISGNTLNGYLNGSLISSADIRYYTGGVPADVIYSGNPGIGFYSGSGCVGTNHESDFGLKSIVATGLLTDNLTILTSSIDNCTVGSPCSPGTLYAQGGQAPYVWDNAAILPLGLSVPSTGAGGWGTPLSGAEGTYNDNVRVTDAASNTVTKLFSQTIFPLLPIGYTTTTALDNSDTFINSGSPTVNYADNTWLESYVYPAGVNANLILVKIPTSGIPDNVDLTSVVYRLWMTGYEGSGGTNPARLHVRPVTGFTGWAIDNVTWANFTGTLGADIQVVEAGLTAGWIDFNITSLARAAYLNGKADFIFAIDTAGDGAQDTNRVFASSQSADTALRPQTVTTWNQLVGPGGPSISAPGKMRVTQFRGSFK